MNTHTNSSTKHFCPDCMVQKSTSACKSGYGDFILPCYILRKIAKKTTQFYDKLYPDIDLMPDDAWTYCRDGMWRIKYARNQRLSFDVIIKGMALRIFSDYSDDALTVDEMFEDENNWGVKGLADSILTFQIKIRDEWFAIPSNKEMYLENVRMALSTKW